jgi:hypothetical protein
LPAASVEPDFEWHLLLPSPTGPGM